VIGINWAQFFLPTRIQFERDTTYKIGSYVREFGSRVLLLNLRSDNKNPDELAILKNGLQKHAEGVILYDDFESEPTSDQVDSITYFAKKSHADLIVAYGSIDTFSTAKAVSLLATNSLFAADILSGKAKIKHKPLPVISIPVEPALGEEISPSFTLIDSRDGMRRYYEHESLFPVATFYDPKIMSYMKPDDIARVGGGAMVFSIESQLSPRHNPLSGALVLKAIDIIRRNLFDLYQDPGNEKIMTTMMWAYVMQAIAAVSSPMGVTYAAALSLKTMAGVNFYDALSLVLPHVMEYYLTAAPTQYISIARSLGEDVKDVSVIEAAIKAVEGVRRLFLEVNLPTRLSEFNVKKHMLGDIARATSLFPHINNAPRQLSRNEIESILLSAY